jgi:hypothetical protein
MANKGTSGPPGSKGGQKGGNPGGGQFDPSAKHKSMQNKTGNRPGSKGSKNKAGGPGTTSGKKTPRPSIMRESTWDRMSVGQRRNDFGTASYAKYKAGSRGKKETGKGGGRAGEGRKG